MCENRLLLLPGSMSSLSLETAEESSSNGGRSGNSDNDDNNNDVKTMSPLASSPNPPGYSSVLLEHLLSTSTRHPGLFTSELDSAVRCLLSHTDTPGPPCPTRTDHAIADRYFPEGRGDYVGELDHRARRSGRGAIRYRETGDRYQGYWLRGVREGMGAYFWSESGSVFAGQWRSGERCGQGSFVFGPRSKAAGGAVVVVSGVWKGDRLKKGTRGRVCWPGGDDDDAVEEAEVAASAPPSTEKRGFVRSAFRKILPT